jgi:hypothetical protein
MSIATPSLAPLTNAEVQQLAARWYHLLDVHAPLVELLPIVDEAAAFKFPEATLHGKADFESWYERVIRIFFDEVHTLRTVDATQTAEGARVQVVVHWEANVWKAPAARSERIKLDAYQTWDVRRSTSSGKPVITRYVVDRLEYQADSAKL